VTWLRRIPLVVPVLTAWVAAGGFLHGVPGDWCLFPALGVFPGMALVTLLPLERGTFARWVLGLAVSPLVSTVAAWALMSAGLPLPASALGVAVLGWALWLLAEVREARRGDPAPECREGLRFAWGWSAGAGAVVAAVMFVNPYLRIRGDAWVHGGIIWEIIERGIPPQDPRFAGLTLNYVWFYNYFIALLTSLRGGDPFALMAISNAVSTFVTLGLAWLIGRRLWSSSRAAAGAALLMALGFNAAMWILWSMRLVRFRTGRLANPEEIAAAFAASHWNDARVIFEFTPPHTAMVSFLDKLLHGTALNVGYLMLLVYLWAMVRALQGKRGPALFWGAAAASGMLFFHGVVGLSVIPVALGSLGLAWLLAGRWNWLPARAQLLSFAGATVAGALLAAPYTIAISRAWPATKSGLHHSYLRVEPTQLLTILTALAVAAWFARRPLRRVIAERRGAAAVLALYVAGMLVFSSVVSLPLGNQTKFIFEVFVGLAVIGGAAFHEELTAWRRRFGLAGAVAIGAVVLAGIPVLTLRGYLLDRSGTTAPEAHAAPGEEALYAWMRAATPAQAVFTDHHFRSLIMVKGRRQLLLGSEAGPERAAFPLDQVLERRAVVADLYGRADSLDRDAAMLTRLGRPAYVLLRAADAVPDGSPGPSLDARPDLFERVYDRDGFIVYHVRVIKVPSTPTPGVRRS
jgi:hypothetical protein